MKKIILLIFLIFYLSEFMVYGADVAINDQTPLEVAPATGDILPIYDLDATAGRRITVGNFVKVLESDVTIDIHASNVADLSAIYLPLAGGTLTGELVVDNLGIEFTPGDDHTDCTAFSATGGSIFFDDSEGIFKKCQDNVLSDLDTGGTINTADIADVSVTQTEFAELETIGTTTISANQWAAIGGMPETLDGTELGYSDGVTSGIQSQLDLKAPLASPGLTGDPTLTDATPTFTCQDSDNAAGTCAFNANSSGGANDIAWTFGVEDSGGESQTYITLDGVNERIQFHKALYGLGDWQGDFTINDATPAVIFEDSDQADDQTAKIEANSDGTDGILDFDIQVADALVEFLSLDGGTETAIFGKPTTLQANDIISSEIATVVTSIPWVGGGMDPDGTQCGAASSVQINSGPYQTTIICADNDASTLYGNVQMPDSWDAGNVTFELAYIQTAADTSALNGDVTIQCRGAGETVNNTWETEVAMDDAAVTGSNAIDHLTSGNVSGTCVAGDTLYWRWQMDATGTTTAVATLHFVGMKMEYTSNVGD